MTESLITQDVIQKFIEDLSEEVDSRKIGQKAFGPIARLLHFNRFYSVLDTPESQEILRGDHREALIFDNHQPAEEIPFERPFVTERGDRVVFSIYPAKGTSFSESEKEDLELILSIFELHLGRFHLIERQQMSLMIQYLTGLPNSGGYMENIVKLFHDGHLSRYDSYYLNLKGFSLINKKYNQETGDAILKEFAKQLQHFASEEEIIGHFGGDNFVALILQKNRTKFLDFLQNMQVTADTPSGRKTVPLSVTIGYAPLESDTTPDDVIRLASQALTYAKSNKSRVVMMSDALSQMINQAKQIEEMFDDCLKNEEFVAFYQPKVNTRTGQLIGAEALCRWVHNGKLVPPQAFIPILEDNGEVARLDIYMLEKVCRDIAGWHEKNIPGIPVSVNFSRKDLTVKDLAATIEKTMEQYGVRRDEIIIEVTETTNEDEKAALIAFLAELHRNHISTSIDDFGTGYSSLSMLREFPVDEIKIDRSFINHDVLLNKDEIIVGSIVDMADELKIRVITEGVENPDQVRFLQKVGCDRVQGFLYDKPLPKDVFEEKMRTSMYQINWN